MFTKRLIIIFVSLLAVAITIGLGKTKADHLASQYQSSQLTRVQDLKKAGQNIAFSDKIIIDREETTAELAAENGQCTKIQAFSNKLTTATELATLRPTIFGILSSDYQNAKTKPVKLPIQSLQSEVHSLDTGCRAYVAGVKISQETSKFKDQKAALIAQNADNYCSESAGCIANKDTAEYKQYFQEDITAAKRYSELYTKNCAFKELQTTCDLIAGFWQKQIPLNDAYDKALAGGDVNTAQKGFAANPFPKEAICTAVRMETHDDRIVTRCAGTALHAVARQYEAKIKTDVDKL